MAFVKYEVVDVIFVMIAFIIEAEKRYNNKNFSVRFQLK